MKVSDAVRRSLLKKSSGNRMFFDALCRLLWCECRKGCATKSVSWEEWADIELEYFGTSKGAIVDHEIKMAFNTPRKVLERRELDALQAFIDTHEFATVLEAQKAIAEELMNDCVACALNEIAVVYDNLAKEGEDCGGKKLEEQLEFEF